MFFGFFFGVFIRSSPIIRYLEKNSKRISQQMITEYNIGEQNFIVNSQGERKIVMSENNPNINIGEIRESNVASIGDKGTIGTAITHQHNFPPDKDKH